MKQTMNKILRSVAIGVTLVGIVGGANADPVFDGTATAFTSGTSINYAEPTIITPDSVDRWEINGFSQNCGATCVSGIVSAVEGYSVLELYKQNVGEGSDTGDAAAWYTTNFTSDNEDATISWVGDGWIVCGDCYLLVKDGKNDPNQFIFDISGWNGKYTLDLRDFWVDATGSISHVALYGTSTDVPAPATLALLGLGALGLGFSRRRKQA